jgi:cysteinyl-tRNA synthetase
MPSTFLSLNNTLSKQLEAFTPRDPSRVTFYSCGPTVYDDAHIGNFRSFLAADVLRRFIESPLCTVRTADGSTHRGPRTVVHVMNITDVGHMTDDAEGGENGEDRMAVAGRRLEEAKKSGKLPAGTTLDPRDPYQIARFYEHRFREDAIMLGLKLAIAAQSDPTLMPRATESIAGMTTVINRLLKDGYAYTTGQPGSRVVYFSVQAYSGYGKLSGNTLAALKAGEGGRVSEENQSGKKHPADFLLWKEDNSHIMKWDSPFGDGWGKGYPGWHIECTVMAASRLAGVDAAGLATLSLPGAEALIDLHSGGEDNIFPHHECEIAQSCCAFNPQVAHSGQGSYAAMWFHPRFLFVEGAKMSKSKGNFFTARQLVEKGIQPAALRLELIRTHYRSNANFTMQGLEDSARMVERWRKIASAATPGTPAPSPEHPLLTAVADALHNDLNVSEAIAQLNRWTNTLGTPTAADAAALLAVDAILGVLELKQLQGQTSEIGIYLPGVSPSPEVEAKLRTRAEARKAKDFATSDRIRDELLAMGLTIKDAPGGKVEVGKK